ncbi:hypothetical protein SWPG_00162 [Synechococcus phage S-CBM2]|nr:hypothetical protein SWPG_00162 [Synechococcus phage S-CBM2]
MPAPTSPQQTPILSVLNQANIQDDGITPNKLQDDGEYTMGSLTLGTAAGNFFKFPVLTAAPTGITPTSGIAYYNATEERLKVFSNADNSYLNIAKGRDIDTVTTFKILANGDLEVKKFYPQSADGETVNFSDDYDILTLLGLEAQPQLSTTNGNLIFNLP